LMSADQRYQRLTIKCVQIRKRSAIHGRSMPSVEHECIWKTRINTGES
jgi:hypothetical protein